MISAPDLTVSQLVTGTAGSGQVYTGQPLAEGVGTATVVAYTPQYNPERGLWYFDVELAEPIPYFPFVRLVVARFQPNSTVDTATNAVLSMSPVVHTDWVQVLPNRTTSITPTNGSFMVTLTGVLPANPPSVVVVKPPPSSSGVASSGGTTTMIEKEALVVALWSNRTVGARIEYNSASAAPDDLGWTILGGQITSTIIPNPTEQEIGIMTVPFTPSSAPAGSQFRLVVEESELRPADPDVATTQVVLAAGATAQPVAPRIVFADVFAVSSNGTVTV